MQAVRIIQSENKKLPSVGFETTHISGTSHASDGALDHLATMELSVKPNNTPSGNPTSAFSQCMSEKIVDLLDGMSSVISSWISMVKSLMNIKLRMDSNSITFSSALTLSGKGITF